VASTTIEVSKQRILDLNVKKGAQYLWELLRKADTEFTRAYARRNAAKQNGPLTSAEVAELTQYQIDQVGSDYHARAAGIDITKPIADAGIRSLGQMRYLADIENVYRRLGLTSAANIGARVDFYSAYLAHRFQDGQFTSIDFQPNLALHNSAFPQSPNWTFKTGYALPMLESGEVKAEMYFFISTATLFNNQEFNRFFDLIATHAKAIAFCEPWGPHPTWLPLGIVKPEHVPIENPYCGGLYACYHHNYLKKLEARGFRIEISRIVMDGLEYHHLHVIASKA
jgi:hypothetical protein